MGYRVRLGKIPKAERIKFAEKTYQEVENMLHKNEACYRPNSYTQLYEIGKYVDHNDGFESFYDFDIEKETECEFHIMPKESLQALIHEYHEMIYNHYERLCQGKEDIQRFLASRAREWCSKFLDPYYLDQEHTDGEIVASWQYEYAIFNLVYIYRTFDWDNDYLIYSGW